MPTTKTKTPTINDRVSCPADRGDKAFGGRVTHVSTDVNTNIHGVPYVWVTVVSADSNRRSSVWPSHRLGYRIQPQGTPA